MESPPPESSHEFSPDVIKFFREIEAGADVERIHNELSMTGYTNRDQGCIDWTDAITEFVLEKSTDPEWVDSWHKLFGKLLKMHVNENTFNQNWFEVEVKTPNGVEILYWSPNIKGWISSRDKVPNRYKSFVRDGTAEILDITPGTKSPLDD